MLSLWPKHSSASGGKRSVEEISNFVGVSTIKQFYRVVCKTNARLNTVRAGNVLKARQKSLVRSLKLYFQPEI